ncbi:serine/arginine-rich splicing factor SC35-like [Camellia sinensis]|uniref:serine/arginine-rich splicing factor SC35-like n=1 Tax=Camellia sinensis TaxID=4442 RepID=UPI0010367BB4|nr:serine/arginine-rich splicing factor SC35-like [Camellia sinensis]
MAKQEGWRKQGTQQGGRILVVRQRGRQGIWRNEGSAGVFTIFVNNIPNSVIPKGFYNLFTKFGVLKDVFMPQKKIRVINTRFGFVRFDCCVAAKIVVEKANGLWVDDKAIEVKHVEFGKEKVGGKGSIVQCVFKQESS